MKLSALQSELEKSYDHFNLELFNGELERVIITVQTQGSKQGTLGWATTHKVWANGKKGEGYQELNVTAEYLNRSIPEIMETILHEMVHISNAQKGIKDCSSNQYHNAKFKTACESIGLIVEKGKRGYAYTKLPESGELVDLINDMEHDKELFEHARMIQSKKKKAPTKMKKWSCGCCIVRCAVELQAQCLECDGIFQMEE